MAGFSDLNLKQQARVFSDKVGSRVYEANRISVLENGNEIFPAMLDAIKAAEESIEFLTYVYWQGEIADLFARALSEKAKEGVFCLALLDAHGAFKIQRSLVEMMTQAGVQIAWYNPFDLRAPLRYQHRTHRKILVCDRKVGFLGGVGIADEWNGDARSREEWHDFHFQIRGTAVEALRAAFRENWEDRWTRHEQREQVRPLGLEDGEQHDHDRDEFSSPVVPIVSSPRQRESEALEAFRFLLENAKRSIRITSAYLIPDDAMIELLGGCVERGVSVEIVVPGSVNDSWLAQSRSRFYWSELLQRGVRLFRYEPTMCHAKVVIVDEKVTIVGSINFDLLSLRLNEEASIAVFDTEFASRMEQSFRKDRDASAQVTEEWIAGRGSWKRWKEGIARFFPLPYWSPGCHY